jgi:hypothetical protein
VNCSEVQINHRKTIFLYVCRTAKTIDTNEIARGSAEKFGFFPFPKTSSNSRKATEERAILKKYYTHERSGEVKAQIESQQEANSEIFRNETSSLDGFCWLDFCRRNERYSTFMFTFRACLINGVSHRFLSKCDTRSHLCEK